LNGLSERCFVDFATLVLEPRSSLRSLFEFLELPDESEAILAKLEELGMPLGMPELKLDHIPEESLPAIEEMCREHLRRCSSAVDWKAWRTIGPVLSESYS
jgi:hypothetical protein